jgi:hypothetical protein
MAAVGPLPCRGTGPRLLTGGKLGSVPVNALGRGSAKADAATGVQAGFDSPGSLRARRAGVGPVELMAARVGQVAVAESYVLRQPPLPHPPRPLAAFRTRGRHQRRTISPVIGSSGCAPSRRDRHHHPWRKLVFHVFAALAEFERDDRGHRLGIEVQPELQNEVTRQLIEPQ